MASNRKGFCYVGVALLAGTVMVCNGNAAQVNKELASEPRPAPEKPRAVETVRDAMTGLAAYYNSRLHGRRTASGERFDNNAMTTAHPSLPFGTRVRVTNLKNNRAVVLRVNDRGPTQPGRVVDVTRRAARQLGFLKQGMTEVRLEVVSSPKR